MLYKRSSRLKDILEWASAKKTETILFDLVLGY